MRLAAAVVLLCCGVAAVDGATDTIAQQRILPLRGEQVLAQLLMPVPEIKMVSVSPDGRKVLYFEIIERDVSARPYSHLPEVWVSEQVSATLWLLEIDSGRRTALSGQPDFLRTFVRPQDLIRPQWSQDGRQLAFLDWRDGALSLMVWQADNPSAPFQRISLARAGGDVMPGHTVRHWAWFAERNEVILALMRDEPANESAARLRVANTMDGYTWFLSRYEEAREAHQRSEELQWSGGLQLRIIDTARDALRAVQAGDAVLTVYSTWLPARDRRGVFIGSHRGLYGGMNGQQREYQMMLLRTGAPEAQALQRAAREIYYLSLQDATVKRVSSDSPGFIRAIAEVRGSSDLFTLESDPSLDVWPTSGKFALLRRRARNAEQSSIVVSEPINLDGRLAAGSEPGTLYQSQKSSPEARLYEVTVRDGRRTLISPPDFHLDDYDVSADGKTIVASMDNMNTAPALYVWSSGKRSWRKLTDNSQGKRRSAGLAPIEKVSWPSKDGRFNIDGFLFKPRDLDPGRRYPLLVFMHGGPTVAHANRFSVEFGLGGLPGHVFAEEGYLVLLPNPRGDRGYTVEFSRAILGGNMHKTVDDLEAGVDALIARGWVDPDRLAIMGQSGGSVQLGYAVSRSSSRYKAAIDIDGPLFLPEMHAVESSTITTQTHPGAAISPQAYLRWFGFDPAQRKWVDPFAIRTPLLLRWSNLATPLSAKEHASVYGMPHGLDYRNSALQQSKIVAYAMKQNDVPLEVIIDEAEHFLVTHKYILEFQSRVLQWCDYFVQGIGENPIPAMKSPLDYTGEFASAGPRRSFAKQSVNQTAMETAEIVSSPAIPRPASAPRRRLHP